MTMILALESSCDETACAVIKDGKDILSSVVSSQINVHTQYGGVVPEVASRIHVENISTVVTEAITRSGVTMDDIDAVAFTQGPGLIGSLHEPVCGGTGKV
jgi:Metal-dependent proteases with possible chaperone activity